MTQQNDSSTWSTSFSENIPEHACRWKKMLERSLSWKILFWTVLCWKILCWKVLCWKKFPGSCLYIENRLVRTQQSFQLPFPTSLKLYWAKYVELEKVVGKIVKVESFKFERTFQLYDLPCINKNLEKYLQHKNF